MRKEQAYGITYLLFLNLAIVLTFLFVLNNFNILMIQFISSTILFSGIFISLAVSLTYKSKLNNFNHRDSQLLESFFSTSQYFFLAILIIITVNQFLKVDFINSRNMHLVVLGLFFGFFAFYLSNKRFNGEAHYLNQEVKNKNKSYLLLLVLLFISFLILRLYAISLNGSYLDEYTHIFVAKDLITEQRVPDFLTGQPYYRGFNISILTTLVVFIFGMKTFYLKLIPLFLGAVNFILLFKITKNLLRKNGQLILLIVYSISHLTIFNHQYLRFYVLYEFILLSLILLFNKLDKFKENKKKITVILLSINLLLLFTKDDGIFPIIFFEILFLFLITLELWKTKIIRNKKNLFYLILIILSIFTLVFFYLDLPNELNKISNLDYKADPQYNSINFFFHDHLVFTILSFLSILPIFRMTNPIQKKILISSYLLVIGHMFLPQSLQLIRIIFYILPIYYLLALISFEHINNIYKNRILKIVLVLIFIFTIINSYPTKFTSSPYIPKEINFIDNQIYQDASSLCNNKTIITSSRPYIALFFGLKPNYYLNTKYSEEEFVQNSKESDYAFFNEEDNKWFDQYSKVELITSINKFKEIISQNPETCLIQGGLPDSWVNIESKNLIRDNFELYQEYNGNVDWANMKLFIRSQ